MKKNRTSWSEEGAEAILKVIMNKINGRIDLFYLIKNLKIKMKEAKECSTKAYWLYDINGKNYLFARVLNGICTHVVCAVSHNFRGGQAVCKENQYSKGWFEDTDLPSRTQNLQRLGVLFLSQNIFLIGRKFCQANGRRR